MELIKGADTPYEAYENLLLERDQISREADQIWIAYLRLFGKLIAELYEEKLECVKSKKIIAYYQRALNHGGDVDAAEMERFLEREMAEYYSHLRRMQKENDAAGHAKIVTPYEAERAKKLYRRLAKLLHPDLNPEVDRSDVLKELWQRVMTAYRRSDVKSLSELEVLARKALEEAGLSAVRVVIPDLQEKIDEIKREIEAIRSEEPYTLRFLVEDEEAQEAKRRELTEELEKYREYRRELNDTILKMLKSGGLKIHVQ